MTTHTKIVCTMGPAVNSPEKVEALIMAGMNVARLNFSHGTYEQHAQTIALIKEQREKLGVPVAIMLDTKGPEIRLGKLKEGSIAVSPGQQFWLVKEEVLGDEKEITLTPPLVFNSLKKEMFVLLDNGYLITHVIEVSDKGVKVEVDNAGIIRSTKGVNIPSAEVELPALTEKDVEDIKFGCAHDVDFIAASFVRSAEHVMQIKKILDDEGKSEIAVIAKIENRQGVQNFDTIVQAADGIMIARGDLGVEMPLAQVPRLQKLMIRKCYIAGKPSVTATQMLESMISNPRPTRAEASDVANAIYDSTSAVMLSGETAVGHYPIETVKVMKEIIEETERDFNYYDFLKHVTQRVFADVPSSVAQASIRTAYTANAKAIFAFTTSGSTARMLSRLRPEMPIIAMTSSAKVYHQLAMFWGVIPLLSQEAHTIEDAYKRISAFAMEKGYANYGDLVVITAGTPFGRPGTTNMIIVDHIGDVLVKGMHGFGPRVHGKVVFASSADSQKDYAVRGKILVISRCDENYLPLLKNAAGAILENVSDDIDSELYLKKAAKTLGLPILVRAEGAATLLREEQLITLDPEQGIVYKGIL